MTKKIALYATDTMADWEYAYLTTQIADAETAKPGRFRLVLAGDGLETVTSLGGLPIKPTVEIEEIIDDNDLVALVIPGGNHYDAGHENLIKTVNKLIEQDTPVFAICGATFLLASAGLLDNRKHTSNAAEYLGMTGYKGNKNYVPASVVTDQGITTASGLQPIPFTAEIMRTVGLFPEEIIDNWEQLNETKEPHYFFQLMEEMEKWGNS